jgi:hypothetical protein
MLIGLNKKCLEEAFTSCKVFVSYIKTFNYIIYINILKETCSKLELITKKMIFIKYLLTSKQYQLYDLIAKEILIALTLTFIKDKF